MAKSKKKSTFAKARRKKKRATIRNPIKVVRRKLSSSKKTNGKKQTVKTRAVGIARDKKDKEVFKGIGIVVEETDEAVIIKKKKREKAAEKAQDTKDSLTLVGTEVPQVPEGLYQPQAIMYFPKEEIEKMHESRAEPGKTREGWDWFQVLVLSSLFPSFMFSSLIARGKFSLPGVQPLGVTITSFCWEFWTSLESSFLNLESVFYHSLLK